MHFGCQTDRGVLSAHLRLFPGAATPSSVINQDHGTISGGRARVVFCVLACTCAQVTRANQLLSVYRAVSALRADEGFQEDASDPQVQAALQDMGRHNNMDK